MLISTVFHEFSRLNLVQLYLFSVWSLSVASVAVSELHCDTVCEIEEIILRNDCVSERKCVLL